MVVSAIGVVQAVIARKSGELAVDALPDDMLRSKKKRHKRLFKSLAFGLCVLTIMVAVLNDHAQRQSEGRATKAELNAQALQVKLNTQSVAIGNLQESVNTDIKKNGCESSVDWQNIKRRIDALALQASILPKAPSPVPDAQPATSPAVLKGRLEKLSDQIMTVSMHTPDLRQDVYKKWYVTNARSLSGPGDLKHPADVQPTPLQKAILDQGYQGDIAAIDASELARYISIESEILPTLEETFEALHFPESKKATELQTFKALSDKAKQRNALYGSGDPHGKDYANVRIYLNSLSKQLSP
jgi:hypothetical protein